MSTLTQRSNSAEITDLQDTEAPIDDFLRGKYKRSFAYKTLKDRLPVILTRIIDSLSRNKENIEKTYCRDALEDIKQVIGGLSKLKNELVTNKPLLPLCVLSGHNEVDDTSKWNKKISCPSSSNQESQINEIQTWYSTVWLISECYMYRRIAQEFLNTKYLKDYDPFTTQKEESYFASLENINQLSEHIMMLISSENEHNSLKQGENLINLIKLSLWGNRADLSLSSGIIKSESNNPLNGLNSLNDEIIVNNCEELLKLLNEMCTHKKNNLIIDIVLDNSGYELFNDLCLASFLIEKNYADKIRFYVKKYPWFISDVTTKDFHWIIQEMLRSDNKNVNEFGQVCEKYLNNSSWVIEEESFWTEPFDYSEMKHFNLPLYNKLSEAVLVIFKGDLNYRKLLGDINWNYTTDFTRSLRGFEPTNIASLRTLKADLCAGLSPGKADSLKKIDPEWLVTGRFGVIQALIK